MGYEWNEMRFIEGDPPEPEKPEVRHDADMELVGRLYQNQGQWLLIASGLPLPERRGEGWFSDFPFVETRLVKDGGTDVQETYEWSAGWGGSRRKKHVEETPTTSLYARANINYKKEGRA